MIMRKRLRVLIKKIRPFWNGTQIYTCVLCVVHPNPPPSYINTLSKRSEIEPLFGKASNVYQSEFKRCP